MTTIKIVGWNCYVGNTAAKVEDALTRWAVGHGVDVFCLSEARTHEQAIAQFCKKHGFLQFQAPVQPDQGGVVNESGDSAILVRDVYAKDIGHDRVATMTKLWRVLSHNKTHTPRQSQIVVLRLSRKVRIRADHFPTLGFKGPNKSAFLEAATRTKAWMLAGVGAVSLSVGDLNDTLAAIAQFFGKRFLVTGSGIDLLVGRGVKNVDHSQLDKGGSDVHFGQLYVVTF